MKITHNILLEHISAALRYGRFHDGVARLPGAPNTALITSSRACYRVREADELARKAEAMRAEAIRTIVDDLRADWSDQEIYKAFNQ